MSKHKTLFAVSVWHCFFSNNVCLCLDFRPTQKTVAIFKNANLLLRRTLNGFQVIYDEDNLDALSLFANDDLEPLKFEFKVYSSDPNFSSYTEPLSNRLKSILYLDNSSISSRAKKLTLSSSTYVSDADLVNIESDQVGDCLSKKDRLLPPLMVVKLFPKSKKSDLFKQWLKPDVTTYSINFDVRKTYWKYYLLGRMEKESLYVVDADNKVEFQALGKTYLPGNRAAYVFRSRQGIPLQKDYTYRFQLREKNSHSENTLINRLPVACLTQMGIGENAENNILDSEIYINS